MQVWCGTSKAWFDKGGSGGVCWSNSCSSSSLGSLAGAWKPCYEPWNGKNKSLLETFHSKNVIWQSAIHFKEKMISRHLDVFLSWSVPSWSHCLCQTAGSKTFSWLTCTQSYKWSKKHCRNTRAWLKPASLKVLISSPRLLLPTTISEVSFSPFQRCFAIRRKMQH